MSERIGWLDAAKGIGIVLVVLGHVERGLSSAGILTDAARQSFDFYLYTFHMPLFMFLSGMNVPGSLRKPNFLQRKVSTIVHPYVVWSLIQGGIMVALSNFTNSSTSVGDLLAIGWRPISPFWFLYALFVFMVVVWLAKGARWLMALAVVTLLISPFMGVGILFQCCYFFIFFVAGMWVSPPRLPKWAGPAALAVCLGWTTLMLAIGARDWDMGMGPYSLVLLPSAAAGIVAVLGFAQLMDVAAARYTGRNSMSIYVMHILAASGTRVILQKAFGIDDAAIHVVAGVLMGVLAPLAAYEIMRALGIAWLFGLGRRPTPRRPDAMA